MKNFEQMTPKELREYIRKNPTNEEAIRVRMKQIEVDPNAINVAYGTSGKDIETILSQTNSLNK
ncbi:DUF6887 family protein [Crocosphaera sp. XPORK-15E]|uniref:DUF6887 family protein n=1 Tax=Crocosphaera sp. XPORK-15E TaxID=3110247 RepID=UPI002B1FF9AD|nr:hypothetical protein [Crocosphaera sp. XPORK-15E]MEA5534781.1 hypothetical protein [Crocosphaera sp. XPORK-15E]